MPINYEATKLSTKGDLEFSVLCFHPLGWSNFSKSLYLQELPQFIDSILKAHPGYSDWYAITRASQEADEEVLWSGIRHILFSPHRLCVFQLKENGSLSHRSCTKLAKYLGMMNHLKETQFIIAKKSKGAALLLQDLMTNSNFLQSKPWFYLIHDYESIVEARLLYSIRKQVEQGYVSNTSLVLGLVGSKLESDWCSRALRRIVLTSARKAVVKRFLKYEQKKFMKKALERRKATRVFV